MKESLNKPQTPPSRQDIEKFKQDHHEKIIKIFTGFNTSSIIHKIFHEHTEIISNEIHACIKAGIKVIKRADKETPLKSELDNTENGVLVKIKNNIVVLNEPITNKESNKYNIELISLKEMKSLAKKNNISI